MGSKGSATTTQQVTIPPEVLARYNAVNAQAQQVAQTPFQAYSNDPNAFVAPLTSTQQSGIANTNAYANAAQPAYQAGMGLTLAGAQAANPNQIGGQQIGQYMSPYLGSVVGTTLAAQQMQNAQQASNLQGQGIAAGAFGGDRSNIAGANLAYQQNMANQQTLANELNTGYNTALATAQQQQGVDLAAQQANLARLTQAGAQLGNLGAGAQTAGLTGAQAQLAAGQAQQQTEQAGLSALYNQFLQQQAYPFQTTQFLANIAEGTGALSGSTTTTTQPAPFFSDERLKDDKEVIGKTFDGQPIYKFKYKGDDRTQIGLMAQDVEKKHPEAVGLAAGYKTVDYDSATKDAAHKGHYAEGGLIPNSMGGAVTDGTMGRQAFADDGFVDPAFSNEPDYNDIANMRQYIMDQQQQSQGMARGGLAGRSHYDVGGSTFNPWALYGSYGTPFQALNEQAQFLKRGDPSLGSVPGRGSYAGAGLQGAGSPHDLLRAGSIPQLPQSGFNQAVDMGTKLAGLGEFGMKIHDKFFSDGSQKPQTTQTTNNTSTSSSATNNPPQTNQTNQQHTELTDPSQNKIASNDNLDQEQQISLNDDQLDNFSYRGGLIKARHHYKFGGGDPNSDSDSDTSDTPYAGVDPTAYVGSSVPKSRLVPDEENKYKLATPSNMPGDPNAQNTGLATAAKTADLGTKLYKGYDYLKGLSGASKAAPDLMEGAKAADAVETSGGGLMAGVDPTALSAQIGSTAGTALDASGAATAAATGATAAETAGAAAAADAAGAAAAGGAAAGGGLFAGISDALGSIFSFLPALLATGGAVRPHRAMGGPVRRRVPPSLAAAFALGHALGKRINLNPPSPLPAGLAPSRYADGGLVPRNAYATDGSVDQPSNDNLYGNMINLESRNRQTTNKGEPLTSPRGAIGIAQIMPATAPEAAKLAGVDFDPDRLKTDPDYNMRLGKAYFDKQVQDFGDPMIAAAAYNAGPARVRQALNRAQDEGGDYTDYLPRETQAYVSHLALAAHGANTAVQNRLSGNEKPTGLNPQLVGLDTGTMSDASNDIRSTIPLGGTPMALANTEPPAAPTSQGLAAAKNQAANRFDIDDQANRNQRESASGLAPAAPVSAPAPSGGLGGAGGQPQQDKNEKYLGLFPKEKTDALLKSSDFWIPLIAGVGSMLGSHSLSLAGAIGDGLVGGSTAWMKNQELNAETNLLNEQAKGVKIENLMKPFQSTQWGNWVFLNDGRVMNWADYGDALQRGEKLQTVAAPDNAEEIIEKAAKIRNSGVSGAIPISQILANPATVQNRNEPAPSAARATTAAPTPAPAPAPAPAPQYPLGVNFDDTSKAKAASEARIQMAGGPNYASAIKTSDLYNNATASAGNAARTNSGVIADMASNIAQAGKQKGFETAGTGYDPRASVVKLINTIARANNVSTDLSADDIQTKSDKYKALLSAIQPTDSKTLGALENASKIIADPNMPPKAATELSTELWSLNQQMIDKENHRLAYVQNSRGLTTQADQDFRDHNPQDMYTRERNVLQTLMLRYPDAFAKMTSGNVSSAEMSSILNKYFKDYLGGDATPMLRYFGRSRPNG
jgi:Transglycosylase SLT domain/Chaperone of endosialidase